MHGSDIKATRRRLQVLRRPRPAMNDPALEHRAILSARIAAAGAAAGGNPKLKTAPSENSLNRPGRKISMSSEIRFRRLRRRRDGGPPQGRRGFNNLTRPAAMGADAGSQVWRPSFDPCRRAVFRFGSSGLRPRSGGPAFKPFPKEASAGSSLRVRDKKFRLSVQSMNSEEQTGLNTVLVYAMSYNNMRLV